MRLWDALTNDASPSATLDCWVAGGFERAAWSDVARDAAQMTAGLRDAGVEPGACVAATLTNTPLAVRGVLACWLAGAAVASLPIPARGMSPEEYADQLSGICERLQPALLVSDQAVLDAFPPGVRGAPATRPWESLAGTGRVALAPPGPDDVAYIQYSSGSTGAPKGCLITTRAIEEQIELLLDLLEPVDGAETGVSWLPLSHDMGMFGALLTAWYHGTPLVLSTPQRFMFSPATWLTDLADAGGTVTMGTDAALKLAARALRPHRLSRELAVRVCIIGAERVHAGTLASAVERLAPYGFREEVLMPAYGLAEATLAVTATPLREPPRSLVVDPVALADGAIQEVAADAPAATHIVGAGPPCRGVDLASTPDDAVGEIHVRSPSLAAGYHGDPELTRERFADGELRTGDLGFVRDGELFPVGRIDDLVSVAGRSVYTREIEAMVEDLPDVRPGCTAIVEVVDGGRLALLAELKGPVDDVSGLADAAARVAVAKAGVALDRCVFLPKGSLPKTPSGKVQRHRCRYLLEASRFDPLAVVDLAHV